MSHVSDFTLSDKEIITAQLLYDNPQVQLTADQVDYLNPAPNVGGRNTVITVAPRAGSEYTGVVDVTYDRLQIQDFVDLFEPNGLAIELAQPGMLSEVIPEINLALGINLGVSDYVDFQLPAFTGLPNERIEIEVPIRGSSLIYLGSLRFTIVATAISLISVISVTHLTDLSYPTPSEE